MEKSVAVAVPAGAPDADSSKADDSKVGPLQSCSGVRAKVKPGVIAFRFLALLFAAVGFGIVASTGTREAVVGQYRLAGRGYKKFGTLGYVVAANAILFVYSIIIGFWSSLVQGGCYKTSEVSRTVMSYIVQCVLAGRGERTKMNHKLVLTRSPAAAQAGRPQHLNAAVWRGNCACRSCWRAP